MKEYIVRYENEHFMLSRPDKMQELVRCKDCVKRYTRICGYFYEDGRIMNDDWFCANGKRKKDKVSSMYGIQEGSDNG